MRRRTDGQGRPVPLPVLAGHLYDVSGGYRLAVIIASCGNLPSIGLANLLPRQATPAVVA